MGRSRRLDIAATGDTMIARRLSIFKYTKPVAEIIKSADARFTNCESLFHNLESYSMPRSLSVGTQWYAEPSLACELSQLGFNLSSLANTHSTDYGAGGLLSTLKILGDLGIVTAGAGRDLDEARESKYLETPSGRVALIGMCWDPWHGYWERASNGRNGIPARPGMNLLRVKSESVIEPELFTALKKIVVQAGLDPASGRKPSPEGELSLLSHIFRAGRATGTFRRVHPADLEDLELTIRDAKNLADWALVTMHSHISGPGGLEYPPAEWCELAHKCIDAGADAFIGHGPHILRGIEVYKNRPIFYSLGNFIAHNNSVRKVAIEQYEFFDLGEKAKPSDVYEARKGIIPPARSPYSRWWFESLIAEFSIDAKGVEDLKLHPLVLNDGNRPPSEVGNPRLADVPESRAIVERVSRLSSTMGTKFTLEEGVGRLVRH